LGSKSTIMGDFISLPTVRTQFISVTFPSLCISSSFNSAVPGNAPILFFFTPASVQQPRPAVWGAGTCPELGQNSPPRDTQCCGRDSPEGDTTRVPTPLHLNFPGLWL